MNGYTTGWSRFVASFFLSQLVTPHAINPTSHLPAYSPSTHFLFFSLSGQIIFPCNRLRSAGSNHTSIRALARVVWQPWRCPCGLFERSASNCPISGRAVRPKYRSSVLETNANRSMLFRLSKVFFHWLNICLLQSCTAISRNTLLLIHFIHDSCCCDDFDDCCLPFTPLVLQAALQAMFLSSRDAGSATSDCRRRRRRRCTICRASSARWPLFASVLRCGLVAAPPAR